MSAVELTGEVESLHGYDVHPVASMFPLIEGDAFDDLVQDIRENGLRDEVTVTPDGMLLDGRNRVRACEKAGVEIRSVEFVGSDPVGFVVSHNLHRRHLTDAQRALIAARMANLQNGHRPSPIGEGSEPVVTRTQAKNLMQVSEGSLHRAKQIARSAVPEVAQMAERGDISLDAGARVARLPEPEQEKFVEEVKAGKSAKDAAPPVNRKDRAPKPAGGDDKLTRPQPPTYGPRRKHAQVLDSVSVSLAGLAMAVEEITELDSSVTSEEAIRLADSLSKSIRSLNRIKQNLYGKATS